MIVIYGYSEHKTGMEIKIKAVKFYPVIGKIVYLCHPVKSQKAFTF
ncbi:MAG: hypothetical protein JWQ38_2432 [Flavipsychrobacter sp.]|nr:hypothetical protein [Flavipsychrobacter sp.]